ncbi:ABC transporter permease [Ruminiclostridium cellobioparum]|uniref:ABC-type antimicrobial peptide transport system, permease component n=1 Tax=Ruminiclostridium cellobioparum subsp. termitidis CT1112 TaxID=1195236 RepID=S0FRK5_RUMCE|nr:ABC transporter permease [Ruminiclostridium cellobioparum]EMS72981.1 ABC-type antimicrobial peptide transport system, permease component [Ruminiclostridium cellobioparum subsp. termitidis CT1112]
MNIIESFKQALSSLRANKLRSILTMIGIVMGVFSVITIVAIGNATQSYMDNEFAKIGANVLAVSYKSGTINSNDVLQNDDMKAIAKVEEIKNVGTSMGRSGTIRLGDKTRNANITGISSQYKDIMPTDMTQGRMINDIDNSLRSNVVVVKEDFAKANFKNENPIGQKLRVKLGSGSSMNLTVIGVTKAEDSIFGDMMSYESQSVSLTIPLTTLQAYYPWSDQLNYMYATVESKDKEDLKKIADKVIRILEQKHGNKDKYYVQFLSEVQEQLNSVLGIVSSVLLVVAVITLVVGGIGIVNILLVSVTERIREIGVRKALGARKRDIIFQFITESIILTGLSGTVGIILGILAGFVISSAIKIPPTVDVTVVILAFLGSVALGLLFGVYPAKRAADLDPIESLRYE